MAAYRRIKGDQRFDSQGFCVSSWGIDGFVQSRPYMTPLPCISTHANARWFGSASAGGGAGATGLPFQLNSQDIVGLAGNKARASFSNAIQDTSQLGVDLAEYSQSLQMIAKRGAQLFQVAKSIRRGDVASAAKALTQYSGKALPKPSRVPKSFANNWLELHFGWVPLFQDIHDAANAMSNPIKSVQAKGRGVAAGSDHVRNDDPNHPANNFHDSLVQAKCSVICRAKVRVSNPSLHLASSLGLINPASVAWELVPFSFVVDWFLPVGQLLNSASEFAGLDLINPVTSIHINSASTVRAANQFWDPPSSVVQIASGVKFERQLGIPSVALKMKPLGLPSAVRAATAVSLCIQALTGK